eukprot:TRINITY_DN1665_c0_g7_i1.p1 TRINITY_DN1665_c0_g7~~TRINITY_DN1665_c0_g7_i1.p1  ORF type:complete len:612 (-),score=145.06 TRINITY_DN1665_c0_g7_i1:134-1969(-)
MSNISVGNIAKKTATKMLKPIREKVSADRMRFEDGEYNLDLAYILPNIIAMAFPGEGLKSMWRNHIDEVALMLQKYHPNHFRIWNLSEIAYDYSKFNNQVIDFGFPDHHNPPLDLLFKIIYSMDEWLRKHEDNVAVVHCVGGKGRTGTVIACYLLYSNMVGDDPLKALDFFAERRSKKKKGVTQPSQRRYVKYFSEILSEQLRPFPRPFYFHRLIINGAPNFASKRSGFKPCLQIYKTTGGEKRILIYETQPINGSYPFYAEGSSAIVNIERLVAGDVLINCYHKGKQLDKKVFRCAFHTAFISDHVAVFSLNDLDDTKKNAQRFQADFSVMLVFTEPEQYGTQIESPELSEAYHNVFKFMRRKPEAPPRLPAKNKARYSCVDPENRTVKLSFHHEGPQPTITDLEQRIAAQRPSKPLPPTPPKATPTEKASLSLSAPPPSLYAQVPHPVSPRKAQPPMGSPPTRPAPPLRSLNASSDSLESYMKKEPPGRPPRTVAAPAAGATPPSTPPLNATNPSVPIRTPPQHPAPAIPPRQNKPDQQASAPISISPDTRPPLPPKQASIPEMNANIGYGQQNDYYASSPPQLQQQPSHPCVPPRVPAKQQQRPPYGN